MLKLTPPSAWNGKTINMWFLSSSLPKDINHQAYDHHSEELEKNWEMALFHLQHHFTCILCMLYCFPGLYQPNRTTWVWHIYFSQSVYRYLIVLCYLFSKWDCHTYHIYFHDRICHQLLFMSIHLVLIFIQSACNTIIKNF